MKLFTKNTTCKISAPHVKGNIEQRTHRANIFQNSIWPIEEVKQSFWKFDRMERLAKKYYVNNFSEVKCGRGGGDQILTDYHTFPLLFQEEETNIKAYFWKKAL